MIVDFINDNSTDYISAIVRDTEGKVYDNISHTFTDRVGTDYGNYELILQQKTNAQINYYLDMPSFIDNGNYVIELYFKDSSDGLTYADIDNLRYEKEITLLDGNIEVAEVDILPLATVKQYLKVDNDDYDSLIMLQTEAAIDYFQRLTGIQSINEETVTSLQRASIMAIIDSIYYDKDLTRTQSLIINSQNANPFVYEIEEDE